MERKLSKYNGYRKKSFVKWKAQMTLADKTIRKVIANLKIFTSREIRTMLRGAIKKNKKLFDDKDCYICKFGSVGKSGDLLMYEFSHTFPQYRRRLIETWEIPALPEGSSIVFVDDLVGSGKQSVDHINEKLNTLLGASFKAYLLCICATPQGKKHVEHNSDMKVIECLLLEEVRSQFLNESCEVFDKDEKKDLKEINRRLNSSDFASGYGNLGLLIAFYFTIPNNTLPFLWMDKYKYRNESGVEKSWFALLPRAY